MKKEENLKVIKLMEETFSTS